MTPEFTHDLYTTVKSAHPGVSMCISLLGYTSLIFVGTGV